MLTRPKNMTPPKKVIPPKNITMSTKLTPPKNDSA